MSEFYLLAHEIPLNNGVTVYELAGVNQRSERYTCPQAATEAAQAEAIKSGRKVVILKAVSAYTPVTEARFSPL